MVHSKAIANTDCIEFDWHTTCVADTVLVQLHRKAGLVIESHPYSRVRFMQATERPGFRWA
jgi:hypothetical protein